MKAVCSLRFQVWVIVLGMPACGWADDAATVPAVFRDAIALWRMGTIASGRMNIHGKVIGVELQGAEREAALARGGDGRVADFDGGYLILGDRDALSGLNGSKAMTLSVRLRDRRGEWNCPLLSMDDSRKESSSILYGTPIDLSALGEREATRISNGAALEYLWSTTPLESRVTAEYLQKDPTGWFKILSESPEHDSFRKGQLRLQAPVDLIEPKAWHDVIIRFSGAKLEMFIDGVLIDEQWPHGTLRGFDGRVLVGAGYDNGRLKSGFHGQIDHVAFWNRALTEDEIVVLSGGKREVARRETEILGTESTEAQYWRPRGYNAFVGDCMLFSHDGRLHLFYLFDSRHHRSKWGMGAHQFGHMSTRDLVHWEQHPMALSITEQTECSLGTGCCVFRNGTYYLYYIQHGKRALWNDSPYRGDNIFLATSSDGITFTKHPTPVIETRYMATADVNPHVIPTADGNRYLMTIAGWKIYSSENLLDWAEIDAPQLRPVNNIWGCTSNVDWNGWHYFLGCGNYVMSSKPIEDTTGWIIPKTATLNDSLGVPVAAKFGDNRCIYAGFATGNGKYGNELVFRELVQEPDGTLGMKWPEEMIPKSRQPLELVWRPYKGDVSCDRIGVRLDSRNQLACAMAHEVPQNCRISFRVRPRQGANDFGLAVRAEATLETGCDLRFDPTTRRVEYAGGPSMDNVQRLGHDFYVDMIVKDDLIDVCVDNRRTLLQRQSATGDRIFLFSRHGEVTFDHIQVRPLLSQPMKNDVTLGELLFANSDFEKGDLTNWIADGDAFDNVQPIKGDNTRVRGVRPIRNQGDYWVGSYERYDGKSGRPGDVRGDIATGELTSTEFTIAEPFLSFLISGGNMPDSEYVALVVDGQEVRKATGLGVETMRRVVWDISRWQGQKARIRIVDHSKAPWGFIDADDFRYCTPHDIQGTAQ